MKEENQRQFTSLKFLLKKIKKSIFVTPFGLLMVPIPWGKKNTKPIITLRRLVVNWGSLSGKRLKYHLSIWM